MNNTKKYSLITLFLEDISQKDDISADAISSFQADGVEEYSLIEKNVDEILGERAYSGGDIPEEIIDEVNLSSGSFDNALKVYFYSDNFVEKAEKFVEEIKKKFPEVKIINTQKDWEDWNEKWRDHFAKIEVSKNLSIIPSWDKEEILENEIYLYPGQGFGTGGHETTFLCLKSFEDRLEQLNNKKTCLDFGCGSGILGLAAIKKLNMHVDFCDVDKEALNNCLQNLNINFPDTTLEGSSLIIRDRFKLEKKYDLVFANILENILILEKDLLLASVEAGGLLILSGVLNNQVENIVREYSELTHLETTSKGDWSCITLLRE